MIKSIPVVGFALAIATSAQATPQAPIASSDAGIMTQVTYGCGAGRTRINGICIDRTTVRQARRCVRRYGGICRSWRYF